MTTCRFSGRTQAELARVAQREEKFTKRNLQPDRPIFQKGGTPMASEQENDEMVQIGLVQDPNDTDPVSGNEIPLGATAEGVRDDEVAAISPGNLWFLSTLLIIMV